jgi:hypothetical protein
MFKTTEDLIVDVSKEYHDGAWVNSIMLCVLFIVHFKWHYEVEQRHGVLKKFRYSFLLMDINGILKPVNFFPAFADGTRTRDLRRDRAAF